MPYPSKIDAAKVINAALALVAREGESALTLRRLGEALSVSANALYRYFEGRNGLIAATADAVAQRLYSAIEDGMTALPMALDPAKRVRALLEVYMEFARTNPALYGLFLGVDREAAANLPDPRFHEKLWEQSIAIITPLVDRQSAPAATVSLWAMVHGLWALQQGGVLGGGKPSEIDDYAFNVVIAGLTQVAPR